MNDIHRPHKSTSGATASLKTTLSDMVQGFVAITHNGLALMGMALALGLITLAARSDLRQDAEHVRDIVAQGALIRVCGSHAMAHDVAQTLDALLAPLRLSVSTLKASERYAEDVF